jgi:hypothetical protein
VGKCWVNWECDQRGNYWFTQWVLCWVNCKFYQREFINLPSNYLMGTLRMWSNKTYQFAHWANCERTQRFLWQICSKCVHSVPEPLTEGSFIKYSLMQSQFTQWVHFDGTTVNSQFTHWVQGWTHCDHIKEDFVKEPSVSGSRTLWTHFEQICQRNLWVLSQVSHWANW